MSRSRNLLTSVAAIGVIVLAGCGGTGTASDDTGAPSASPQAGGDLGQQVHRKGKLPTVEKDPALASKVPESIKKDGTLTVVMSTSSPPAHFTTSSGMAGSDADLAKLIAETFGLKVKVVGAPLDSILPGLKSHRYEVVISQFSPTPERAQVLDFVNYAQSGTSLGVPSDSDLKIDKLCGAKVGVQKGSSQAAEIAPMLSKKCESKGSDPVELQTFPDSSAALLALRSSRIDGVLIDSPVMGYAANQSDGKLKVAGTIHQSPVAIGTPKDDGMIKPLQAALQRLDGSGALDQSLEAWGMHDSIIHKFSINAIDNG